MKMDPAPVSHDAYLRGLDDLRRKALTLLRSQIKRAAPKAAENTYYRMPAFSLGHPLVCYYAFQKHCSFFVMSPKVLKAHAALLKGYRLMPSGIRFDPATPLPAKLVTTLVKARIAEEEELAAWRANRKALKAKLLAADRAAKKAAKSAPKTSAKTVRSR